MARLFPNNDKQQGLFATDAEPIIEEEERTEKTRDDFDPNHTLASWAQEASNGLSGREETVCRVARFKNGRRAIQTVRGDQKNPAYVGAMILEPNEYYSFAQCIFRDSHLIRELCTRFPPGSDPTVDKIRDFVQCQY